MSISGELKETRQAAMQLLSIAILAVASSAAARTFTVKNNCNYPVWPAIFTDTNSPNCGTAVPDQPTGWKADPGSSVNFNVPDNWKCGRIWGRAECDFSANPGPQSCKTGGCAGGLECTGNYEKPASVAEWTFDGTNDNYDVSLVDGFNIPLEITNNKDCPVGSCPVDLNNGCPAGLEGPKNGAGAVIACNSDCNVDPNHDDSPSCCTGSHNKPETCPSSGVPHYSYFKDKCPKAYAFAYDEPSGALLTCPDSKKADYTLTFCP
ncbi:thaumatin-like protein [Moniliophthora roreri]|nr:thaumatin-like protein [Moniliophthora roreri]